MGQAGILRGGWLPPLSGANAAVGRVPIGRTQRVPLRKLPHKSAPCLAYVYARQGALLWGSLRRGTLWVRPIGTRPTAAFAPDSGGSQPPRRMPACPISRQRFHLSVVHKAEPFRENHASCDVPCD